jgi:7-carboxy-7-deazaguanine synthase
MVDACVAAAGDRPRCALKIVVFDDADYAYARETAARFPALPTYLQVGNPAPLTARSVDDAADVDHLMDRFRWLIDKVTADRWFSATVLPQLHVLTWGNKRGV